MADDYELLTRSDGRIALVPHGPWHPGYARVMAKRGIDALALSDDDGWDDENLDFLADVPPLAAISVQSTSLKSAQGLQAQPRLRDLLLDAYRAHDTPFGALLELERCFVENKHKHIDELFELPNLRSLEIWHFPNPDLQRLKLPGLEQLTIASSPRLQSLAGLQTLAGNRLRKLWTAYCPKLADFTALTQAKGLRVLWIDNSRQLDSLELIHDITTLEQLGFDNDGNIESLAPIAALTRLQRVFFTEDTKIVDGDISPLLELPDLREVGFQNRRHYSHTREQIRAVIERHYDEVDPRA